MTDDLVKRLEEYEGSYARADGDSSITLEAADRIEELEKQLAELIKYIKELENELENMEYEMCEMENRQ
jgi:molecular chaperone GrpE (heat shock protein)